MTLRPLLGATVALSLAACAMLPQMRHEAAPSDASLAAPLNPIPTTLTGYLPTADIDGAALLGPPPSPDSLRGQADRAYYNETRALAGTPRWNAAIRDNDIWGGGALKGYACAAGKEIGPKATPVLYRLLHRIELDVRTVGKPAKDHYNRPRPLIGDTQAVCVPREDWMKTNASYPSGHTMVGWAWGLILTELAPGKADGLMATAKEVGESRAVCGVHYQSDIEAGRMLASAMVARLHGDPAFQRDLATARRELARSPALSCPV
ncbi:phosphatase PAP2 family protein [Phenylobacterium sp.]|uniref:acid phosphatase n=1 Tax=Phenylobacterium sp. TaxID=1871053 RepID=UPI0030F4ADF1